ncbi:hypothetical protein A2291_06770 [candidate division WOR-1 bacterium RIFOXYB2_FULL_42_35]|uniref:Uncharacterized protein n=1 Tax=candidate division WOR-1 bacterium RIFOXYC2_FULL_41_25 TaxID=1802586 RepID=A0A1F4TPY0_UNCSA|nr:MAG: hypothetical protein A2291_06770 [candidate division WOR-1 bacterium RIFOXYB2_FULL_42_35]OGC24583.1 MAG: hypothetical protein A2247_06550 [candidate division WOR-1 bacterium RIFOXYA2_FULL_41_14]OGC34629.1 MAG: hypothetical protein A2462_04785 [candidate division WOR-1 bacterium RIFOXYC2_FULL_41_25]OGC42091.1 MAG: hypothetical protein A2548_04635 [candidate division WOR-1 bacterium RIFOXYD2_FULL_41_8]
MDFKKKILVLSAYLTGIPAIYLVLSDNNRAGYLNQQARKAFILWLCFFALFFTVRLLDNLLWKIGARVPSELIERLAIFMMMAYAVFRAHQAIGAK